MAIEVAKLLDTEKVILISSAKTRREIPFYYRWAGALRLHRLVPVRWLKTANSLIAWLFGANTESDKQLLRQVLKDTDEHFLRWAIEKIVTWSNTTLPAAVLHLHGDRDRVLPFWFISDAQVVKNGGHLMVLNRAKEVSALLQS